MKRKPLTADQVREQFKARGETITAWAARHGYPRRDVYNVIAGVSKGWWGRTHEIAIALGMKLPADESSADHGDRNTQSRQAA